MSSFTITTPEASLNLRPSSVKKGETAKGTATYSVTNRTGETKRARVSIDPGDGAEQSWFTVRDGDERDIAPGATESFSIDLAVPPGSPNHSFEVVVVNLEDSDNDFARGSTVAFNAPALTENGPWLKWWMIAAPIALVLIVGGVIVALWPEEVTPPVEDDMVTLLDFRGSPIEKAREAIAEIGVTLIEDSLSPRAPEFDRQQFYNQIIVQQEPVPESDETLEIRVSATVKLGWEWKPKRVTVPTDLADKTYLKAAELIQAAGLTVFAVNRPPIDRPNDRNYEVVLSFLPRGEQDAGTGISLQMKWKQAPNFDFATRHQLAVENARRISIGITNPRD